MSLGNSRAPLLRCLGVLLLATATAAATLVALLPSLRAAWSGRAAVGSVPFDRTLVELSAVALAVCVTWLWLGVLLAAVDAASGVRLAALPVLPPGVRRLVLAGCGVAVLGAASPAVADPGSLAGLPLPERATVAVHDPAHHPAHHPAPPPLAPVVDPEPTVTVRPGDTLWDIAARHAPPTSTAGAIAAATHRLYRLNRGVIGPDPDRLVPGQHLRLPRQILSRKDTT